MSYAPTRRLLAAALLALAAIVTAGLLATPSTAKPGHSHHAKHKSASSHHGFPGKRNGDVVSVMTRNLYLGADLTPAIEATSQGKLFTANGQILDEVIANDFPRRAKGLAQEILSRRPDLVGLQEVALWATGPFPGSATNVLYDYLGLLMGELNRKRHRYDVAVVQNEFGLEAPADTNGDEVPDLTVALQMRDVILVRDGVGVMTRNETGANFDNPLVLPSVVIGPITVDRGWTSVDAKVRGSGWFRFVNTHLEAFHPRVRGAQAQELVAPGGPATSNLPVVLVGDLNSDDDTVSFPDTYAYNLLLNAGMENRSTDKPLSCCLNPSLLAVGAGGSNADFDHQVDHVLTRDPVKIGLRSSTVTGRHPTRGFWSSDHAGVFSALRFK